MNIKFLLAIAFGCLMTTSLKAQPELPSLSKESGGMLLELKIGFSKYSDADLEETPSADTKPEAKIVSGLSKIAVICKLTNKTSQPIKYGYTYENLAFVLGGTDPDGKILEFSQKGRRLFVDSGRRTKYVTREIPPNGSVEYEVRLSDIFIIPVKGIKKLSLTWNPGIDGYGNLIPVPKDLAVALDLKDVLSSDQILGIAKQLPTR